VDEEELVVTDHSGRLPPECEIATSPTSGPVPLHVVWLGKAASTSGNIVKRKWYFDNGTSFEVDRHEELFQEPTWRTGVFYVEDSNGMSCLSRSTVIAQSADSVTPPRMLKQASPELAKCGEPFVSSTAQQLGAQGDSISWHVPSPPAGLTVDEATGAISWTPSVAQVGEHQVVIHVRNDAGQVGQSFVVAVECADAVELNTPFGCSAGAGGGQLAWMLGGLWARLGLRRTRRQST
jgi:hypothetical protein